MTAFSKFKDLKITMLKQEGNGGPISHTEVHRSLKTRYNQSCVSVFNVVMFSSLLDGVICLWLFIGVTSYHCWLVSFVYNCSMVSSFRQCSLVSSVYSCSLVSGVHHISEMSWFHPLPLLSCVYWWNCSIFIDLHWCLVPVVPSGKQI